MAIEQLQDDYLAYRDEEYDGGNAPGFAIDSDDKADWAVRKVAQAEANIERRKAFVDAEIERIKAWQAREDERDESTITRMTGLLEPYFESLRESGALGKRKSYPLPSGVLQVRASQPKFARDDTKLVAWAKAADAEKLVKVEEKPVWVEIRRRLKTVDNVPGAAVIDAHTGEIVDGVTVAEAAGETFSVKTEVRN